jgi:hypothetical protein
MGVSSITSLGRLMALADALGQPTAVMANGFALVAFTPPSEGSFEGDGPGGETEIGDAGDSVAWVLFDGVEIGDSVYINSLDDFDQVSSVSEEIVLTDCVAPTTTLNYAYNTCGHLAAGNGNPYVGNGGPQTQNDLLGYDTDYAGHQCVAFEDEGFLVFGDGGEDAGAGDDPEIGIPTLNLTCRLFKDQSAAGQSGSAGITVPTSFFGLKTESGPAGIASDFELYDASEWDEYPPPVSDTIGVAFSEDITKIPDTMPSLDATNDEVNGVVDFEIESWTVQSDITNTDDANGPLGEIAPQPLLNVDLGHRSN